MASVTGEEETEYESDPEEAKLSLAMRRREASDDEEEVHSEEEERRPRRIDSRSVIDNSDEESDGQGGAADYDDEEFDSENEEYYEQVEVVEREDVKRYDDEREVELASVVKEDGVRGENVGEALFEGDENVVGEGNQAEGEEKKQNEPFSVPTAGAFYMHDDRFRENAVGSRQRATFAGKKLWESKDVRRWGHDKFEEMSIHERHYEQGRRGSSRGRYQARGRNIASGRGYTRGGRSNAYNNGNNQNQAPKSVRGRGPRRYEPSSRNRSDLHPPQTKQQSGRSHEKASQGSSGKVYAPKSSVESDPVPQRKSMVASSLSSASPPFYPSGASGKSIAPTPNRNLQHGSTNKNLGSSVMGEGFSMQQSNASLRGKNIAAGTHKPYIDDHNSPTAGRGSGFPGQMHFQPNTPQNQANRSSPSAQLNNVQRSAGQSRTQPTSQSMGQRTGNRSQAFSPPSAALSINSFESGGKESAPESSKSNTMMVAKGKGNIHGNGRGPFPYNGAQVMAVAGNMGFGHSDQNFPGAPTFLPGHVAVQLNQSTLHCIYLYFIVPCVVRYMVSHFLKSLFLTLLTFKDPYAVMQFGGQHPGGMGVPAVGMAFPGYVGQSEGMRNSEMTWLPVLAGAAGALGATYGSPYMPIDGAYHGRSLEAATSSDSSSKEITDKVINEEKTLQKTELAGDEFGHRQNKPRRYSEMNFGQ